MQSIQELIGMISFLIHFHSILGSVSDKSISGAIVLTEHLCRKDFVLEADEEQVRRAAHQLMRAMTAATGKSLLHFF